MTAENFAYWLQGFFEVSKSEELTKEQVQEIKNHLALVFNKVTPLTPFDPWTLPTVPWPTPQSPYTVDTISLCQRDNNPNLVSVVCHASC